MTEVEGQLLGRAVRIGKVLAKYGLRERPGDRTLGERAEKILRGLGLLELFAEKTENREELRRVVDISAVIEHLSDSLRRELDFRQELDNVERLRVVLASYPRLDVPEVYADLSTSRLLVLEFVPGVPIRQAPDTPERRE